MQKGVQRPILVCNVGWMARYQGLHGQPDKIVGGGQFVVDNDLGHECCNFLPTKNNLVFGHFETIKGNVDRKVSLERLGVSASATKIEHVDVVWVATHPQERGRRVVGYYLDATVYRERQHHAKSPTAQHRADGIESYVVTAPSVNAVLLPLEGRNIRLGKGSGWIGQANWWFPEASAHPDVPAFLTRVRALLATDTRSAAVSRSGSGKWGGSTDPERNARVEQAAVAAVETYFSSYIVKSVEKENCGWDLELYAKDSMLRSGKPTLVIEVKGLSSTQLLVGVTPNEFDALKTHMKGELVYYRLCVVTNALSANAVLHILRYAGKKAGWVDEFSDAPVPLDIREKTAAIISLDR